MDRVAPGSGSVLGILGGGQLARMIAMAAARLDIQTVVYDPDPDCPAAPLAGTVVDGAFDNTERLARFARMCHRITFEFENIPLETARGLSAMTPLCPAPSALETSQDRLVEKDFLNGIGLQTAPYGNVQDPALIPELLKRLGGRAILKTRRLGYDGKGQLLLDASNVNRKEVANLAGAPCILEGFVEFEREISVIAVRDHAGDFRAYDPVANIHAEGILRTSTVPAGVEPETARAAMRAARDIMESLSYVGVMGVEFFVSADGTLLVNEIAPRVHNSGHWTEAACAVSQFENHVRAVMDLPLGDTARHSDAQMTNLIGADIAQFQGWLGRPHSHIHLYGKREVRAGRKMGHVTEIQPATRL